MTWTSRVAAGSSQPDSGEAEQRVPGLGWAVVTDGPPPRHKPLLAAHADPSAAASICGGLGGSLQGPAGHFQRSLHTLVPTNKSSGVDEDASLNPAELWQRFITNAAPFFQQGQPATGRQTDGHFTDRHICLHLLVLWISFISFVTVATKLLLSLVFFVWKYLLLHLIIFIFECISILAYILER